MRSVLHFMMVLSLSSLLLLQQASTLSASEGRSVRSNETRIWEVGVGLLRAFQNQWPTFSPTFSVWNGSVEERWYLELYPNGDRSWQEGMVSIHVTSQNNFATYPVMEVLVLNKKPQNDIRRRSSERFILPPNVTAPTTRFGQGFGWSDFATLRTLLDPSQGFIFDDKVKFGVKFVTDPTPIREPTDHKTLTFYWTVGLKTMDLPNEMSTESLKFHSWAPSGGLISWKLRLFPQGKWRAPWLARSNIRTSFHIVFNGEAPYATSIELFVKNVKSENILRHWLNANYTYDGEFWDYGNFIYRDLLIDPENGFVNNDEIVFGLRIPNFNVNPVQPKQVTVNRMWEVGLESFLLDNAGRDEIYMESPQYIVWNRNKKEGWYLRLFPNGIGDENNGFVSLFLVFDGNHTSVPFANVFIENEDHRNNIRRWSSEEYTEPNQSKGWPDFITKKYLLDPSNGFVVDNKIKFGVQLRTDPLLPKSERPMIAKIWEIGMEFLQKGPEKLESPAYEINIHNVTEKWHLWLYPRGNKSENAGFVSIYLVSLNNGTSYPSAEVFILNKKPENMIRKWMLGMQNSSGASIGWTRFIKFSDLIDTENGFVFGNETKSIKVGFSMPLESDGEIIPGDWAADPDPVIIPKKPKVKPTPAPSTTPSPVTPATTTAFPFEIEAFVSNF